MLNVINLMSFYSLRQDELKYLKILKIYLYSEKLKALKVLLYLARREWDKEIMYSILIQTFCLKTLHKLIFENFANNLLLIFKLLIVVKNIGMVVWKT